MMDTLHNFIPFCTMTDDIFNLSIPMTLSSTLAIYESQRSHMPPYQAGASNGAGNVAKSLRDVFDDIDALFLDGYGILNIGQGAVPEADMMLKMAYERGIAVVVLTNGASKPSSVTAEKYPALGLPIKTQQVVSSRDALLDYLENMPDGLTSIGVADSFATPFSLDGYDVTALNPDDTAPWDKVDAIALMGAVHWDEAWQIRLEAALRAGKKLYVANPDVAAPQQDSYSREPGFWVAKACYNIGHDHCAPLINWFGKPYAPVFDLALKRLHANNPDKAWQHDRIAMVGDSLHTDILGGQAAGLKTILVKNHGLFRDGGADEAMAASGIIPDYIVDTV